MSSIAAKPITKADLIGCWKLERAAEERDGVVGDNPNYGEAPVGFLHYVPDDRVSVMIVLKERGLMSVPHPQRRLAPIEELAEAARSFDGYAGRFELSGPQQVTHYIEASHFQNQVGEVLVRRVDLKDDLLILHPVEYQASGQGVRRWLEWRRLRAA